MYERNSLMSEGNVTLEDLHIDGRIILKWILKKYVGRKQNRLIWAQDKDEWQLCGHNDGPQVQ
jgi:hypothetical protein